MRESRIDNQHRANVADQLASEQFSSRFRRWRVYRARTSGRDSESSRKNLVGQIEFDQIRTARARIKNRLVAPYIEVKLSRAMSILSTDPLDELASGPD